jgi:hypothetical protein
VNEHAEFDLLDEYCLATLPPAEMLRVREHLATCTACRREYDELRNVLDVLPFALDEERPTVAARKRLLARLDAPEASSPPGAAVRVAPRRPFWIGALAAAFALALAGDAWSAWQLSHRTPGTLALASPTPAPVARASAVPAQKTPPRVTPPRVAPAHTPVAAEISRTPAPAPRAAAISRADVALRARVATLAAALRSERRREETLAGSDRRRIVALEVALANQTAALVALRSTPVPSAAPPSPAPPSELVAALSGGRVYGVDGVVGTEPWHLTIVQPPAGANALIFTDVPHAPNGETYRTWVLRGGKTFDAGELPAGTQTKLVMPMPLEAGDVVAFSQEPLAGGDRPTNPFLMQVKI